MSYCNKGLQIYYIDTKMNEDELTNTLNNCELNCERYYQCDTVAHMEDKLKELDDGDVHMEC